MLHSGSKAKTHPSYNLGKQKEPGTRRHVCPFQKSEITYASTHWAAFYCGVSVIFLLFGRFDCRASEQAKTGTLVCLSERDRQTDRLTGSERRDLHVK